MFESALNPLLKATGTALRDLHPFLKMWFHCLCSAWGRVENAAINLIFVLLLIPFCHVKWAKLVER